MKTSVGQRIGILFILLVGFSFLSITGCSGLRDWWGYDASSSRMVGNNHLFANSDLNQFYSSVRPVNGTVESDYRLARYFQKRGKYRFAVDELLKAIHKDPSFIKAYNALGVSYDHLGQFNLAVKSYKFALQLNPDLDYVHNNLGYSYLLSGDLNAAIEAFRNAIAIDNSNKRYHNNLALAYVRKGQPDMAYNEFKLAENTSETKNKMTQIFNDPNRPSVPEEKVIDTLPEGITPYDDIPKVKETLVLLNAKKNDASKENLEQRLTSDGFDEIDPGEKSVKSNVESFSLDLSKEDTEKTENLINYTVQVSALYKLKDATRLMEMLTKKGYRCPYLNKVGNERPYYRVRLGRFNDKKEINGWITDLTHILGNEPFIAIEDKHAEKIVLNTLDCFNTEVVSPAVAQPLDIEISNGNGVRHMARDVGSYLNPKGFHTSRLTNADHFNYPKTKIYYQRDYEQDALRLANEIPTRQKMANLVEQNQMMRRAIKVLIGKDLVPFHEYIKKDLKVIAFVKKS